MEIKANKTEKKETVYEELYRLMAETKVEPVELTENQKAFEKARRRFNAIGI